MFAKDFLPVAIYLIVGVAFIVITLLACWFMRPNRPSKVKQSTYECGEVPVGQAWLQFRVGYYIYALIFLIFDVEAVFLFPWAAQMLKIAKADRAFAIFGLVDMTIFVAVLVVGLLYAWKKGVLEWK